MQFHRTSWTIRPARTWLCERGQTWRSDAPRRVHLSPISPGVEKGVKLFPWATGKKVGICDAFAPVTHCRSSPCTWASAREYLESPRQCIAVPHTHTHTHTQTCSNVTLGETPKMHEKQKIRTLVEFEDLIVALGRPGNNWGMLCTPVSNFAPYAWKYFLNIVLNHKWNHLFVMQQILLEHEFDFTHEDKWE